MKKKVIVLGLVMIACVASLVGCKSVNRGNSGVVHCDRCGKECSLPAGSNADESWTVYCDDCEKELGLDQMIQ